MFALPAKKRMSCPANNLQALRKANHPKLARHIKGINKVDLSVDIQQACMRVLSFVKSSNLASTFKASPEWLCRDLGAIMHNTYAISYPAHVAHN